MPHRRHDLRLEARPYPGSPVRAFTRAVLGVLGGLFVLAVLWRMLPPGPAIPVEYLEHGVAGYERWMEITWGFEWTVGAPNSNAVAFFSSRIASPFVWGPLLVTGLVALACEYRRRISTRSKTAA